MAPTTVYIYRTAFCSVLHPITNPTELRCALGPHEHFPSFTYNKPLCRNKPKPVVLTFLSQIWIKPLHYDPTAPECTRYSASWSIKLETYNHTHRNWLALKASFNMSPPPCQFVQQMVSVFFSFLFFGEVIFYMKKNNTRFKKVMVYVSVSIFFQLEKERQEKMVTRVCKKEKNIL